MVDVLSKEQRSYNMSRIKGKNTMPELYLRKLLYEKGFRGYRIHSNLVGKPDIFFPKYRLALFVDGCFWHGCKTCFTAPESNKEFWMKKIESNIKRDKVVNTELVKEGYMVMRIPEHLIRNNPNRCYLNIRRNLLKKGFKLGAI